MRGATATHTPAQATSVMACSWWKKQLIFVTVSKLGSLSRGIVKYVRLIVVVYFSESLLGDLVPRWWPFHLIRSDNQKCSTVLLLCIAEKHLDLSWQAPPPGTWQAPPPGNWQAPPPGTWQTPPQWYFEILTGSSASKNVYRDCWLLDVHILAKHIPACRS